MLSSLKICLRGLTVARSRTSSYLCSRTFFSEKFRCSEEWDKRTDSPILRKVNLDRLYIDLDARLNQTGEVSAVDIDIFANSVNNPDNLEELDDLLHRFRMGSNSGQTLTSTHHAVVRAFVKYGDQSELLRILNDRLNYGIFPDDYLNYYLLDHFVKSGDFTSASKVAAMRMLQEDFADPLLNYMSLFVCHKYLLNPSEWEPPPEPEPEDDGEEVKVRVAYLRNPYFDDHFDLRDPHSLIGKTLYSICRTAEDPIGRNYLVLGLCLHKKWDSAEKCVSDLLKSKFQFYSPTIQMIDDFIGSLTEEEQKPLDNLKAAISEARKSAVDEDLLSKTEEKVKSLVSVEEGKLIEKQCQAFVDWENVREATLKAELEEMTKKARLKEIEKKKEELKKEEEEIFFFDNEDKVDLAIENNRVTYPKKWLGKKKIPRVIDKEYVPPEITKKKPGA